MCLEGSKLRQLGEVSRTDGLRASLSLDGRARVDGGCGLEEVHRACAIGWSRQLQSEVGSTCWQCGTPGGSTRINIRMVVREGRGLYVMMVWH
eukprot:2136591-Rhodomonas_salina.4